MFKLRLDGSWLALRRKTSKQNRSATQRRIEAFAWRAAPWLAMGAMAYLWPKAQAHVRTAGRPDEKAGLSVQAEAHPLTFEEAEPGRGRLAPAPTKIPAKGWKDVAWRVFREINADQLPTVAAGVTFYTLLALFPAIGVFVSLYGIFADVGAVREQLADMSMVFPREVVSIIGDQMLRLTSQEQSSLSIAFVVSLLLSVWTANAGMKALFNGLNVAYDETEKRNFFVLTATTYGFTFGVLVFLVLMSGLLIGVPVLLDRMGLGAVAGAWIPLRWLVLLLVAAGAFTIVYRYGPCRRKARWTWVSLGGAVASVLWLAGSLGFSFYVNNFAHYDATYGSLGAVIGFMMWIWFSVMVVLIGAELNAEVEHQTAIDSTTGQPKPMGNRGAAMADSVGLAFHFDAKKILSGVHVPGHTQAAKVEAAQQRRQPNSSSSAASRAA